MNTPKLFDKLISICGDIKKFDKSSLPLCAAENVISPFSQIPLDSFLQEKYIMGGVSMYQAANNFIGSDRLFQLYNLLQEQCFKLFQAEYSDARTLSGVNAVTTLLMSLFSTGDKILLLSEDAGGHSSMPKICTRLGLIPMYLPYDFQNYDLDYNSVNKIIEREDIKGILLCPSDIIKLPELKRIHLSKETVLIFDATQVLGIIASGNIDNPFDWFSRDDNFILLGATHKTLSGPTCGLIMTNNMRLASRFDTKINPDYLRNVQLHHIVSLILALMEFEIIGSEYSSLVVRNANILADSLKSKAFVPIEIFGGYSYTHQVFISMEKDKAMEFYKSCEHYGVTLNLRQRKIYKTCGIRIGTQQISRYGWSDSEMVDIAIILEMIRDAHQDGNLICDKIKELSLKKTLKFTLDEELHNEIYSVLHDS